MGTRLSGLTKSIPKPLVKIKNKPIVCHIMDIFISQGFNDFILATGHKSNLIKKFFSTNKYYKKFKISCKYTGKGTMTGGRVLKLEKYLKDEKHFFLTYGDGLCNINLRKLLNFHKRKNKILTVTGVRPPARFGYLKTNKQNIVTDFSEKKRNNEGWINGGFFVATPKIFSFIENSKTSFEREPLEKLSKISELSCYKHNDFWQCMDTPRDKEFLEDLCKFNNLRWLELRK